MGNTEVKKPEYEADNFRVSRHGGSVANGSMLGTLLF